MATPQPPANPPRGRLCQTKAQHTIEYIVLITLIMAGIIIGGPYAIRSWNAHIKSWEDSVVDSFNEPLMEAPPGSVDLGGCRAGNWQPGACGGPTASVLDPCAATMVVPCPERRQKIFSRTFSPQGCQCPPIPTMIRTPEETSYECRQDDSFHCCTDWVTPSGCLSDFDANCPREPNDCGVNVGCPDGYYRRTHTCDTGYTETECQPHGNCVFTCQGPHAPNSGFPYGSFCDAEDTAGLTNDTSYRYLDPNAPCTATKCEIKCNPTFIAINGGTDCNCPAGQNVGPSGLCECDLVPVPVLVRIDTRTVTPNGYYLSTYDDFRNNRIAEVCALAGLQPPPNTPQEGVNYGCIENHRTVPVNFRHNGSWGVADRTCQTQAIGQGWCAGTRGVDQITCGGSQGTRIVLRYYRDLAWVDCVKTVNLPCGTAGGTWTLIEDRAIAAGACASGNYTSCPGGNLFPAGSCSPTGGSCQTVHGVFPNFCRQKTYACL